MKRLLLTLILLFPVAGMAQYPDCPDGHCPAPQTQAPITQGVIDPAVCRIKNTVGRASSYGSGTLIEVSRGQGLVITCSHLFREGEGTVVCIFGPKQYAARTVADKDGFDLTALLVADPGIKPIPVAHANPRVRDMVQAAGFGPDGRYLKQSGLVMEANQDALVLTGAARQGDSGGPILNRQGELVGVLWGTNGQEIRATAYPRTDAFLQRAARYLAPWNAETEQERIKAEVEKERIRAGAQPQYPPSVSGDVAARLGRLEGRVDSLERVAEAAKSAAANASTEAGKAFAEAVGVRGAAEKAVEEATPGLLEKVKGMLPPGLSNVWGWVTGSYVGMGVIGLLLVIVWKDVRDYIKTGGKDKLLIQHAAALLGKGAARTSNTIDDRVTDKLQAATDRLAGLLDRFSPQDGT